MLGKEKIDSLQDKVILVAGIGGVGGTALEALARSGFMHFIIIDFDVVDDLISIVKSYSQKMM